MAEREENGNYCTNCKRDIASVNFVMHEVHCKRNIVLCEACEEPVPRSELEAHIKEEHAPVVCDLCSQPVQKSHLAKHQESCPKRKVSCVYCELETTWSNLQDHLAYCGTRTEQCLKCHAYVMHKDLQKHEDTQCAFPEPVANGNHSRDSTWSSRDRIGTDFSVDELSRVLEDAAIRRGPPPRKKPPVTSKQRMGVPRSRNVREPGDFPRASTKPHRHQSPPPHVTSNDLTADQLLALQLEYDESGLLSQDLEMHRDRELEQLASHIHDHTPFYTSPDVLPCEFCGEFLPLDSLFDHQNECPLQRAEVTDPVSNLNNDSERPEGGGRPRNPPFMVDNLLTSSNVDSLQDEDTPSEDTVLPCEFCDVLLPIDALLQHQANCEAAPVSRCGTANRPRTFPNARQSSYLPKTENKQKPDNRSHANNTDAPHSYIGARNQDFAGSPSSWKGSQPRPGGRPRKTLPDGPHTLNPVRPSNGSIPRQKIPAHGRVMSKSTYSKPQPRSYGEPSDDVGGYNEGDIQKDAKSRRNMQLQSHAPRADAGRGFDDLSRGPRYKPPPRARPPRHAAPPRVEPVLSPDSTPPVRTDRRSTRPRDDNVNLLSRQPEK